jgi:hypothetical protein
MVVVVASQGLLPQEGQGHQVAKLEHANASSKLHHGLPCTNLLATMLHLILNAFIVPRLEYFIKQGVQEFGYFETSKLYETPQTPKSLETSSNEDSKYMLCVESSNCVECSGGLEN